MLLRSNCCDARPYAETEGLCSACGEHAEFRPEECEVCESGNLKRINEFDWVCNDCGDIMTVYKL